MPTSVALGLLSDETYTLDDARARRPPAQYVRAIMRHGIGCNIVDVANQLSFAYRGLAPELRVFVSPPTEFTKAADFIRTLEEKQEVWHEMMTTAGPQRYYNPTERPLPYKPPLPSQAESFSRYQSQYRGPVSQQPWRPSERSSDPAATQRQYTQQPFRQNFMPQRQQYPTNDQRMHQVPLTSSPTSASRDTAPRRPQPNQSTGFNPTDATTKPRAAPYLDAPRQRYQSG